MNFFNKPLREVTLEDVKDLADNKYPEVKEVEYKREIEPNSAGTAKLAKHVSAFANTEGGYLIIGVDEAKENEPHRICGVSTHLVGNQKTEEWLDSIITSNISPRVNTGIWPVALPTGEIVVIIRVPRSSRRPHMSGCDNKYYIRRNTTTSVAEEREVRWMFESGMKDMETISKFLQTRNLDAESDASNSRLIANMVHALSDEQRKKGSNPPQEPYVTFAICPKWLEERLNIASPEVDAWLSSNKKGYSPVPDTMLFGDSRRPSLNSIVAEVWMDREKALLKRYIEVFRNGFIEMGACSDLFHVTDIPPHSGQTPSVTLLVHLTNLIGAFMIFLGFAERFYKYINYHDELSVLMLLSNVNDVMLGGFGGGVINYYSLMGTYPVATLQRARIEKPMLASDLNEAKILEIAKYFAERVSLTFGEKSVKCFDNEGKFISDAFRYY